MISVVILTKNEEANISDCIKSVSWCDEAIVVDDCSEDRTVEFAKKLNAKTYIHPLSNDFSSQRNFGLSRAKGDWILFVDADERVSDALSFEISNIANQITDQSLSRYSGFYITRNDLMWGRKLRFGETSAVKLLRLAKKNSGKWEGKVHENWKVKGRLGKLKNPIIHFPHQTLKDFLSEINFYTSIRASELYSKKTSIHWWSVIFYPLGKFVHNYVFRKGFLDRTAGLVFAIIMSFHSFLIRGKLWVLKNSHE